MAFGSSSPTYIYPRPAGGQTDERLTVSSSAVPFSSIATWRASGNVKFVVLDVQSNDVFVTFDGSTPTSTNGHRLYSGESYTWNFETAAAAQFIRASADATVHASPFTF